jgi:hypothetical protein
MSQFAQKVALPRRTTDASIRAASRQPSSLAVRNPFAGTDLHRSPDDVNQSPRVQAIAQLHRSLNQNPRVAQVAALSTLFQPRPVVQRLPINKGFVKTELAKTSEGLMALDMLDRVKVYEYQRLTYRGVPKTSYATTLPHESPPVIFVNEKKNSSDEEGATTLYHEVQHAFDPETPAKDDNSNEALRQDLVNEARTIRLEAEFAIKMGGNYLNAAVDFGSVTWKPGGYVVNEAMLEKIASGDYSNYATQKRSDRFDIANYTDEGRRDLSGDWYPLEAYKYDIDYSHKPGKGEDSRLSYIK